MKWIGRTAGGVLGLAVIVPALLMGGGYAWLRTGLPETRGTVEISGLMAPVEIVRDRHAVPHIFASNDADAYFALGYVHAQDRLWQMDMQRRIGAGRLSELIGEDGLRIDRFMRVLDLYGHAARGYDALAPEVREALDAYTNGVNAWIDDRRGPLPVEFQILRYAPDPWTPADSLVWGKLMALQLSGNYRDEILASKLLRTLTPEQLRDLDRPYPADGPVTLLSASAANALGRIQAALPPPLGPSTASNAWVLSGDRTTSGKPILVNDPHLSLQAPILWYLARIETPMTRVAGATVPGVPFHVLGHNGHAAWGFTTTGSDVQDLFIEKPDPNDPSRYLTPDGSEPFAVREEVIRIRDAEPVTLTVRSTRHGPVLSDIDDDVAGLADDGFVVALAFPALSDRDTTAEALWRLNRVSSWETFLDAMRRYQAPQQNIFYADAEGTIGLFSPALVPIRKAGDGRLPVPGWTGEYDWIGFIPFDALPRALDPESGQLVNANNRLVGPEYPYFLTARWEAPYRAERIEEMLDGGRPQSVEDAGRMLLDTLSVPTRILLPVMTSVETSDPLGAEALAMLRDWDGTMDRDRPEPLIFEWWLRELHRALYADELGPLFEAEWSLDPRRAQYMLTEATAWCDDVRTDAAETCAEILARAFERTLADLRTRHGSRPADWRWGAEHVAPLQHQILSRVPGLRSVFDIGIETDGSYFTVHRGATRITDENAPFASRHGAGYRAVYDLADPSESRFVIATGQSGNPLSPHYGDFVGPWRDGESVRLAGDRDRLITEGGRQLTLTPR